MKGVFKCTALAAVLGLIGSSAAMAAGTAGAGNMVVSATITSQTCSASFSKDNLSANLPKSSLVGKVANAELATLSTELSLSQCKDVPVKLALGNGTYSSQEVAIYPDGMDVNSSPFNMQTQFITSPDINWGSGGGYDGSKLAMDNTNVVTITPTTNSSTYTLKNIIRAGTQIEAEKAETKDYVFTYTYSLTYA
ncbi:hypothetical protein HWI03_004939 [Salmonella enterica]|nr:hypothetical protein [Salmonella enterica]